MKKKLLTLLLMLSLAANGFCAWNASLPADNSKLKDTPAIIRAMWDAIALGTDAALLITNAKVSPTAAIVDTKLAQITTASKVSVSAITGTLLPANGGLGLSSAGGTANRILGTTNGSTYSLLQVDLASAMITGILGPTNGGIGLNSVGGVANRVLLTTNGTAYSVGQVDLTSMVTGTLPVGNLPVGTGANQIVQLDGNAKLPAVDGSQLTGITTMRNQLFTSSGTFTAPAGVTKVYLSMVAGGGGGGGTDNGQGGGGGGSAINYVYTVVPTNSYTVTVGTGGAGGANNADGNDGLDTTFDGITVYGGKKGLKATTAGAGGTGLISGTAGNGTAGGKSSFGYGGGGHTNGSGYGSGGGGGASPTPTGGNGADGMVLVYW